MESSAVAVFSFNQTELKLFLPLQHTPMFVIDPKVTSRARSLSSTVFKTSDMFHAELLSARVGIASNPFSIAVK